MATPLRLAASLLAAPHHTPKEIQKAVEQAEAAGADLIHIDVMDGRFVEEKTIWNDPHTIKQLRTKLPLDVHIMIDNPDERYLEFIHAGANRLTFHVEAARDPEVILEALHHWHVKAGLAINPETPFDEIKPYLHLFDYVHVMSVHPGKAGQAFIPATLETIITIKHHYPHLPIEVDGGINEDTIPLVVTAGASIIVEGTAFYHAPEPRQHIERLHEAATKHKPLLP